MDFPPRAQPLFNPSGKTLKSLSSKTKAPGAAATGRGKGELITHPEHPLGCSHRPPAPSPVTPKPRIQHGAAPELSLEWGRRGGETFHENPLCCPPFQSRQRALRGGAVCVCDDLFPWSLQAERTKLWHSLTSGQWERGCSITAEVQQSVQGFGYLFSWDSSAVLMTRNPLELSLMPCPSLTRCPQCV